MEKQVEIEESKGKNKGFTLIELLIVIVILGILAAVTVFAVRGITDKGKTNACASDQNTLATAVESYFAQYGGTGIPHSASANSTAPTVTYASASVTAPAGAGWTSATTADGTLVNAGFLRTVSAKYMISEDGKTLTATTAGGC
jgi:prepilin-type N-terminal cleavage/methylation domain-containing protein